MKTKPILFSADMIRALLQEIECQSNGKTQTRRVIKPQPKQSGIPGLPPIIFSCPYGHPSDLLWVREKHQVAMSGEIRGGYGEVRAGVMYDGENTPVWSRHTTKIYDLTGQPDSGPMQFKPRPWTPSIYMPRRLSRITLQITDVRVQRVQDISADDAIAEGVERVGSVYSISPWRNYLIGTPGEMSMHCSDPRRSFQTLWDSINEKRGYGWSENPWVWCISFRPILANVDDVMTEPERFGVSP